MNRRKFLQASSAAAAAAALSPHRAFSQSTLPAAGADGWVSLLNGRDLTGWYSVLQQSGKDIAEKRGMIAVEEGMLHLMGNPEAGESAEAGYLATHQEFENVHIRVEFKWGMKRFAPRQFAKRDNGILYGLVGPDKVWPTCIECQIEEGDVGDYFFVACRGIQDQHANGFFGETLGPNGWPTPAKTPQKTLPTAADPAKPDPGYSRAIKDGNFEILDTWNTVEVIWQGDRSAHIVNGRTVNAASKIERPDPANPGQFLPMNRGKIAIELEFAEIWFRRIEVKSLA